MKEVGKWVEQGEGKEIRVPVAFAVPNLYRFICAAGRLCCPKE